MIDEDSDVGEMIDLIHSIFNSRNDSKTGTKMGIVKLTTNNCIGEQATIVGEIFNVSKNNSKKRLPDVRFLLRLYL